MASRDKKSSVNLYPVRKCKWCGEALTPTYANQQIHADCFFPWRRDYQKNYQRKVRKDLKEANDL